MVPSLIVPDIDLGTSIGVLDEEASVFAKGYHEVSLMTVFTKLFLACTVLEWRPLFCVYCLCTLEGFIIRRVRGEVVPRSLIVKVKARAIPKTPIASTQKIVHCRSGSFLPDFDTNFCRKATKTKS